MMRNLEVWRADYIFIFKSQHVSGPTQFKPTLFKGQLYLEASWESGYANMQKQAIVMLDLNVNTFYNCTYFATVKINIRLFILEI